VQQDTLKMVEEKEIWSASTSSFALWPLVAIEKEANL